MSTVIFICAWKAVWKAIFTICVISTCRVIKSIITDTLSRGRRGSCIGIAAFCALIIIRSAAFFTIGIAFFTCSWSIFKIPTWTSYSASFSWWKSIRVCTGCALRAIRTCITIAYTWLAINIGNRIRIIIGNVTNAWPRISSKWSVSDSAFSTVIIIPSITFITHCMA